ncbi:MAG: sulfite exporter TauE/SafE family protein [Alphaproteobacteria bacterium]
MDLTVAAIAGGAFFFAAFAKGITGMGFATTCLPIIALPLGLEFALPLVLVPSVASNIIVQIDAGHLRESLIRFWPMLVAAVIGVVIGLTLLTWLETRIAGGVLGAVLVIYGVFAVKTPDLTLPPRLEKPLGPPTGLATGIINGLTGSQLMPVLPYLMALHLDRERFVQAINCSFTVSSLVMAAGLSHIGLMNWENALISTLGIVPVWIGLKLGGNIRRRISAGQFRNMVIAMLMASGVLLIVRAI